MRWPHKTWTCTHSSDIYGLGSGQGIRLGGFEGDGAEVAKASVSPRGLYHVSREAKMAWAASAREGQGAGGLARPSGLRRRSPRRRYPGRCPASPSSRCCRPVAAVRGRPRRCRCCHGRNGVRVRGLWPVAGGAGPGGTVTACPVRQRFLRWRRCGGRRVGSRSRAGGDA